MNQEYTKQELIEIIKRLIVSDDTKIDINPNYIEYFEYDELLAMKNDLEYQKQQHSENLRYFLDDIYENCKDDN